MKCQNLFSGKNKKKIRKIFPECFTFNKLIMSQEKMDLISNQGNEGPDHLSSVFTISNANVLLVMSAIFS